MISAGYQQQYVYPAKTSIVINTINLHMGIFSFAICYEQVFLVVRKSKSIGAVQ